ncbi:MAG TPA: TonB family protein [Terracidiphilus sp.]|nr:TonB family protein [Terracidiphilus sp.]
MSTLLEANEQLERTFDREPVAGPAMGSLALHAALACSAVFYGLIAGLFHHNTWGGTPGSGTIQVQITSSIPLPAQKLNDNVLTTSTPSEAPALPETKPEQQRVDLNAIPIPGKHEKQKPKPQPLPKTQPHQQPRQQDNYARYGEQAGQQIPRSMAQSGSNGPTSVSDTDFGSRFPWYVDGINRKMATTWNKAEVDGRTPRGARVFVIFTIHRDGSPSDVQLSQSSGSGTLDSSCVRAVQRVDTFGQLPAGYNQSTLKVFYYCEY